MVRDFEQSDEFQSPDDTGGILRTKGEAVLKLIEGQPRFEELPKMQLGEYRSLVAELARPSDEQIENFVAFVSEAKSWYKHLPPLRPGVPFFFFIDPFAGFDRVLIPGGQTVFLERTERTDRAFRFHYTWMPTETYRARFGYLSFSCEAGSELHFSVDLATSNEGSSIISGVTNNNWASPVINSMEGNPWRVPDEILEAGRVELTGIVHPVSADGKGPWMMLLKLMERARGWPSETDGDPMIARIRDKLRAISERRSHDDERAADGQADPELDAILKCEQQRLHTEMVAAMRRVRTLLYAES